MIRVGPYPVETSFYPEHVAIPFITLVIFTILLYVMARIKARLDEADALKGKPPPQLNERAMQHLEAAFQHVQRFIKPAQNLDSHNEIKAASKEFQLGVIETWQNLEKQKFPLDEFKASEIISVVTLIVTIVTALVVPFAQLPVLDYSVIGPTRIYDNGTHEFEIAIHNYGAKTGKNVIVSFKAEGAKFDGFSSLPFLEKRFTYNTTTQGGQVGKALVEIKELPPRSYTVLSATVSQISDDKPEVKLITYLRSEEAVAYHQTSKLILFYGILVLFYVSIALAFSIKPILLLQKPDNKYRTNYRRLAVTAIPIISGIIAASFLMYLPHVDTDTIFYAYCYWTGTLIIPVTIAILAVIYSRISKSYKSVYHLFAVAAALIISGIIAASSLNDLPNPLYYWTGILIIPVMVLIIAIIYKIRYKNKTDADNIAVIAALIISGIIAASSLNDLPNPLYYWTGILIIPVMVLIIAIIYKIRYKNKTDADNIAVIAALIISGIIAASSLNDLPNPLYYWTGILIIPVMVLIIAIIYKIRYKNKTAHTIVTIAALIISGIITVSLLPHIETEITLYSPYFWIGILIIPVTILIIIVTYGKSIPALGLGIGIIVASCVIIYIHIPH